MLKGQKNFHKAFAPASPVFGVRAYILLPRIFVVVSVALMCAQRTARHLKRTTTLLR
jgi:hypothetical protein